MSSGSRSPEPEERASVRAAVEALAALPEAPLAMAECVLAWLDDLGLEIELASLAAGSLRDLLEQEEGAPALTRPLCSIPSLRAQCRPVRWVEQMEGGEWLALGPAGPIRFDPREIEAEAPQGPEGCPVIKLRGVQEWLALLDWTAEGIRAARRGP